jgi:hypothetical protein
MQNRLSARTHGEVDQTHQAVRPALGVRSSACTRRQKLPCIINPSNLGEFAKKRPAEEEQTKPDNDMVHTTMTELNAAQSGNGAHTLSSSSADSAASHAVTIVPVVKPNEAREASIGDMDTHAAPPGVAKSTNVSRPMRGEHTAQPEDLHERCAKERRESGQELIAHDPRCTCSHS